MAVGAVLIALAFGAFASADAADFNDPLPRYERAGGAFGCRTSKEDFEKSQTEKRDVCLKIVLLFVSLSRSDVESVLGKPMDNVNVGPSTFAYLLQRDSNGKLATYAVVTYATDDRADSIQITGAPWSGNWQFSGIALGAAQEAVVSRLGEPLQTGKSDDPGSMEWTYKPWTFSFEVKSGVVSSIRISAK